MNENLYSLSSITELCHCDINLLVNFICSQRFNFILHCYDPYFKIPEFVYFIVFPDFVKIGRTFDLRQRYLPSELKDSVKRIVFVSDIATTEKELKTKFSKKFELFSEKSLERFKIKDIPRAIALFDEIVKNHKTKEVENRHIKVFDKDPICGTGYFVSPIAASILISSFCNYDLNLCISFIETVEKFCDRINKNDFIANFTEKKQSFFYWKFHGYIIIVNSSTEEVNISRFWKSVTSSATNEKIKDLKLWKFLQMKSIQDLIKINKIQIHSETYNSKPLMNGKWAPLMFIHIILYELNSKYMLRISRMLTKMILEREIEIDSMEGGSINPVREKLISSYQNVKFK